jgi:hypothetical protein
MLIQQTQTAIECYHGHQTQSAAQRTRVLQFIETRGGSWSIGELAHALGLQKSTVSARVNELLYQTKELVEWPKRKDRRSGVMVRPVSLPAVQRDLFGHGLAS